MTYTQRMQQLGQKVAGGIIAAGNRMPVNTLGVIAPPGKAFVNASGTKVNFGEAFANMTEFGVRAQIDENLAIRLGHATAATGVATGVAGAALLGSTTHNRNKHARSRAIR